jgi:formylmethanofuran dehydrogenase subunit B
MSPATRVAPVTCLGCGCTCDDLTVQVADGRIVDVAPPCPLGRAWFGDGSAPARTLVGGADATLDAAVATAAELLAGAAGRALVVLGPEVSVETHRAAAALADALRAAVMTATSEPAAVGLLTAQRRGRAAATLGEIRNRADVLLFWAVDPAARYPRYTSRYALEPKGTHIPTGRAGRTTISASVGADRGPRDADVALSLTVEDEIAALSVMRAVAAGNPLGELPPPLQAAADVAKRLAGARYAVIVHEAEPGEEGGRDPYRAEGLIALAQALNGGTRAALSTLRAGGNRSGAEAVLTWQTGYPLAVSYAAGFPRSTPNAGGLAEAAGAAAAILVVGSAAALGDAMGGAVGRVPAVVIGPRASEAPFATRVAIDTGVAGIHEGGIAYRMDDVPLPLRPPLGGRLAAAEVTARVLSAARARLDTGRPG